MDTHEHQNWQLISAEDIIAASNLKGVAAKGISNFVMSTFKYNNINELYVRHVGKSGKDFIADVLTELEIKYDVVTEQIRNIPQKGAFIMVSNHPYGGVDGLILMNEVLKVRPDLKVMGNFLFNKIKPLNDYIIPVNPFDDHKDLYSNLAGMKLAMKHLTEGKPLLIFPAGEVSTFYSLSEGITDRKWLRPAIKFIKGAKVPVLPIYFQGSNSLLFHSLGMVHPLLRTIKLPSELFNKKNRIINFYIGSAIPVSDQDKIANIDKFGRFLRAKTYLLGSAFEVKKFFKPAFHYPAEAEKIIDAVNPSNLTVEVAQLPDHCLLFRQSNYSIYCAPAVLIPNIITELGRLREITFRDIGEGTNRKIDVDEYDLYYRHLFIWDTTAHCLVGAYRIGMGKEILHRYGIKGFYIRSLFKMDKRMKQILSQSMELGRSFVVKEYQRSMMPLFLLWKGILHFLVLNADYRYLTGPVSISNSYSNISKSLIIKYIEKKHFNQRIARLVRPKKKFVPSFINAAAQELLTNISDIKELDMVIKDIDPNNKRIPVLIKKYLELKGEIICFNIDPQFSNALDGLLLLDLYNIPEETILMLSKEMDTDMIVKRFSNLNPYVVKYAEYASVPQY